MTLSISNPSGSKAFLVFTELGKDNAKYAPSAVYAASGILRDTAASKPGSEFYYRQSGMTGAWNYYADVPTTTDEYPALVRKVKDSFFQDPRTREMSITVRDEPQRETAVKQAVSAEMKSEGMKWNLRDIGAAILKMFGRGN